MVSSHVLKVPFEVNSSSNDDNKKTADQTPSPADLLVHISTTSPASTPGKLTSDLSLQATDGEYAFAGSLPLSRVSKSLSKDAGISAVQFEAVIAHLLLGQPLLESQNQNQNQDSANGNGNDAGDSLSAITLSALLSPPEDSTRTIRLRFKRSISSIAQIVGEISLREDYETPIDVCVWTRLALEQGAAAEREARDLRRKIAAAEDGVGKIQTQLQELLKAKADDEGLLLERFAKVLATKKARVRELESGLGRGNRLWRTEVKNDGDGDVVVKDEDQGESAARGSKAVKGKGKGKAKATPASSRSTTAKTTAKAGPSRTNKRKQPATQVDSDPEGAEAELVPEDGAEDDVEVEDEEERRARRQFGDEEIETDRESLQDLTMQQQGEALTEDSDDLDAPAVSQRSATRRTTRGKDSQAQTPQAETRKGNGRQHALRGKQKSPVPDEVDEMSTDDEL